MRLSCCPPSVAYRHLDDAFPPVLRRRRALAPVLDLDAEFVAEPSTTPEQVDDDAVGRRCARSRRTGGCTSTPPMLREARADPELAVDAREVDLDRLRCDEQRLGDLAVRVSLGRHLGDAALAGRERVDAAEGDAAWPRAGRAQLRLGLLAQWCGSAVRRQLDRTSKYVPCFRPAISAAQRRPELGQRLRQLEPRRRSIQDLDRFPQQPEPFLAAFHESRGAKRPSERARRAPDACELEFLTCESARLLPVAQLE